MQFTYTGDEPVIFPGLQAPDGSTLSVAPGDVVDIDPEVAAGVPAFVAVETKKAPATPAADPAPATPDTPTV